jgi:hypothetical protein
MLDNFETNESHVSTTLAWLKSVVIDYAICPFAKGALERGGIRFHVNSDTSLENCLVNLIEECVLLEADDSIDTTLLIYANAFQDFDDYLNFLEFAENLMMDRGYEGIYQLASFHPAYCFEGATVDDPANYTNRSPYPMLHLLRETSIDDALKHFPQPETIPARNIKLTRDLGLAKMRALLASCYQHRS